MKYTKGYKYQLAEDEIFYNTGIYPDYDIKTHFIELTMQGKLTLKKGYAWDGPSGPTIDRKTNMRGSGGHDGFYQLIRNGHLDKRWRKPADDFICQCWIEDGMFEWLAKTETKVLKKCAGPAADPKNIKKVYEAPAKKYLLKRKLHI